MHGSDWIGNPLVTLVAMVSMITLAVMITWRKPRRNLKPISQPVWGILHSDAISQTDTSPTVMLLTPDNSEVTGAIRKVQMANVPELLRCAFIPFLVQQS